MIVGLANRSEKLLHPKKKKLLWEWALSWRFPVQGSPNYKFTRVTHCEVDTVKFAFHQMHKATSRTKRKMPSNWPHFPAIGAKGAQRCLHGVQLGPQHKSRTAVEGLKGATETYPKAVQGTVKGFQSSQPVMELKSQQKHLPVAYIFHSPVKPVTGPLPVSWTLDLSGADICGHRLLGPPISSRKCLHTLSEYQEVGGHLLLPVD